MYSIIWSDISSTLHQQSHNNLLSVLINYEMEIIKIKLYDMHVYYVW